MLCGVCNTWEVVNSVSNGYKHITASTNYLWSIRGPNAYICARPCTGAWVRDSRQLMQVDASDDEVWGVSTSQNIYKKSVDGKGSWMKIRGGLKHVTASGNGYIWGVNRNDQIYKCKKPCTGQWKNVGGRLSQIDGGYAYVYGVNSGGAVYSRSIDGSGDWRRIPSVAMKHITASGNDDVFATSRSGEVYRCRKPCVGDWEKMSTDYRKLAQLDASFDAIFGVSVGGAVIRHKTGK